MNNDVAGLFIKEMLVVYNMYMFYGEISFSVVYKHVHVSC